MVAAGGVTVRYGQRTRFL